MEQTKVKELPEGYFVTDTYYPSGDTEFVSEERKQRVGINPETGYKILKDLEKIPKEIYGTKHIQLIAANPRIESEGIEHHVYTYFWCDELQNKPGLKEFAQKAYELQEQGKDFFIYKVSEEE